MMGISKYIARTDLLRQKSTGITPDISADQQRLFNAGHEAESSARPIAEGIIGEALYPATVSAEIDGLPLLASLDGMTMDGSTIFEHKLINNELRNIINVNDLPDHYRAQLEQQLMVAGATRCLFIASNGTEEDIVSFVYQSNPDMRRRIIDGWKQFRADIENYQHVEHRPEAIGKSPEALPALRIEITGMVTASNLADFRTSALSLIGAVNTDLQTDQDFADAEKTIKWCGEVESRLDAAKQHALSQTASIDELFRTLDSIKAEARQKRLELDRLVKGRKEFIRGEIQQGAVGALQYHYAQINSTFGGRLTIGIPASFGFDVAAAMKGKKTVASLRDAADTSLARGKISANEIADRVRLNLITADEHGDYAHLFPDIPALAQTKEPDDFRSAVLCRIAQYKEAEQQRIERDRERTRQQETEQLRLEQERAAQHESTQAEEPEGGALDESSVEPTRPEDQIPLKLSDITARLGFPLSADFIDQRLHIKPGGTYRRAAIYRSEDWPLICSTLIRHIEAVKKY